MKIFKLSTFQKTFSDNEFLLHESDFPDLRLGDILEIISCSKFEKDHDKDDDDESSNPRPRLILSVEPKSLINDHSSSSFKHINQNTIYIEKSIADEFLFQNYKDVCVRKLENVSELTLDSVELTFKDQYLGRSEMWRIKKTLVSSCLFTNKKIEFCDGTIRVTVHELWGQGIRLYCGIVTKSTKIVFRSPTAMIYLFIQMSSEMWDFNIHGDLYFEKTVDGFLYEMFDRWKKNGAAHEVTIVLFSRCFYKDESPETETEAKSCLQKGPDGALYEDFYRVIVQNERFDDWNHILVDIRNMFTDYKRSILEYHSKEFSDSCWISNASQGNFLEVLNVSLNTFANFYQNRSLDRTGQQSIVITPGAGVFEVDRDMALMTKQRIIDSGVGSDLICIGEQPLHAVPLLKFHSVSKGTEDYNMPHWINLSFYNRHRQFDNINFIPRIKIPTELEHDLEREPFFTPSSNDWINEIENPTEEDIDEWDRRIYTKICPKARRGDESEDELGIMNDSEMIKNGFDHQRIKSYLLRPGLMLVNPFDPSLTKKRMSSNRRRWTHIFSAWSSQLTTGVDWKSLTIPASLPTTTDYFPDKDDFENDYVFNEYNLSPEEINSETHETFDVQNIFTELISQRLAQGFQLIDMPEGSSKPDYWLSIGRNYHKLSLVGKLINVARYRPSKPFPNVNMRYHYRFQAPDNDTYEVSWVEFKTEKLENFNWNYLDHYVITKGSNSDFHLTEALKYWRFRMYLLPLHSYIPITKKIKEESESRCDRYEVFKEDYSQTLKEGFIKFVETCLNGLRKIQFKGPSKPLESSSKDDDILSHLKNNSSLFLSNKNNRLPRLSFVSYEAIMSCSSFGTINKVLELLENCRRSGHLCHCSGDSKHPFLYGFYLYYIVEDNEKSSYDGNLEAFKNDWVEIQMQISEPVLAHNFLQTSIQRFNRSESYRLPSSGSMTMDFTRMIRSDRPEWIHVTYNSSYDPNEAFELILQWIVATGALVAEIVGSWARKSQQQCGLSCIPIPSDPFALPVTQNSDPVRGPIFIGLDSEALSQESGFENHGMSFDDKLFLFRESVARKFGFIPLGSQATKTSQFLFSTNHQYVHCTGNMFLLIPTQLSSKIGIQGFRLDRNSPCAEEGERIFRHVQQEPPDYDHSKTGFLWSWNFMISKRWKNISNTGATGDIFFMDKMLKDFRAFCRNDSQRLVNFWNESWNSN